MTKRKPDWADKAASTFPIPVGNTLYCMDPEEMMKSTARLLRRVERRGFARAVKLLREQGEKDWQNHKWTKKQIADWLEKRR